MWPFFGTEAIYWAADSWQIQCYQLTQASQVGVVPPLPPPFEFVSATVTSATTVEVECSLPYDPSTAALSGWSIAIEPTSAGLLPAIIGQAFVDDVTIELTFDVPGMSGGTVYTVASSTLAEL